MPNAIRYVCVRAVKKQATKALKFVNRDGDSTIQQFPRTEEMRMLYCLLSLRVVSKKSSPFYGTHSFIATNGP
jgi:hypothetical protein